MDSVIKLNNFVPREYQIPVMDAMLNKGYRRCICIMPRRSGKDMVAWQILIRSALRRVANYWMVYPTYSMGKKILWTSITNEGVRFIDYIPPQLISSTNSQEMIIRLKNGSTIQVIGTDNPDRVVGTNAYGIVFSEFALQDVRAYTLLRPVVVANGGWMMFISCVVPNTLVIGSSGLHRIKNVSSSREQYSDLNKPIFGLGGFNNAEQFYYGGKQPTLKIVLSTGHFLQCTPIHQIWTGSAWKQAQHIKTGELLPIQYGQDVWGSGLCIKDFVPNEHGATKPLPEITDDFMYLLGLIHADGNYNKNSVCVTKKKDAQIIDFLHSYGFVTRPDGMHHEYPSKNLCALLEYLDFKHGARKKSFPDKLFRCTKSQMRSFIQGIFDGDGTSNSNPSKRGNIKLTSTCLEFLQDLSVVLLNFGIVGTIRTEDKSPTEKVKVHSRIYNLEIGGYFAHIFYRDIGFRLERKQRNNIHIPDDVRRESGNIYPVDSLQLSGYRLPTSQISNTSRMTRRMIAQLHAEKPHPYLEKLLAEKFYYSPVKEIIACDEEDVFDFVIPHTHSFFNNGLIGHNTPRGKNHCFDMFKIAEKSPDWFSYKLTVEDTKHISLADIQKEKEEGLMSEDLIQQEYYCDWNLGIEGSYYNKYIDKMRIDGRIGDIPYDAAFPVSTSWDLGVRDSTTIIFFQVVGQTVRIIDAYENSKMGLEHYIKVIKDKEYVYSKHFAPHDIAVQEFGSGLTRIEKAKDLGLTFHVAPNIKVEDGIECVRSNFSKLWIDQTKCKNLIAALENYRQEFDEKRKIYKSHALHNWASHYCFTADTLVLTRIGMRQIIDIEENDEVMTLNGWKPCTKAMLIKKNAQLVEVEFQDGTKVKCTPDHLFLTEKGWTSAEYLTHSTKIQSSWTKLLNTSTENCIEYGQTVDIFRAGADISTGISGDLLLGISLQIATFITKIAMLPITLFQILNACLGKFIYLGHAQIQDSMKKPVTLPLHGINQKKEFYGIKDRQSDVRIGKNGNENPGIACTVKKNSSHSLDETDLNKNSAIQIVKHPTIENVRYLKNREDVWCISVPSEGHFSLSNGAIVKNCDAMRYLCLSLPKTKDGLSATELNKRYKEAMYGADADLPIYFRDDLSR